MLGWTVWAGVAGGALLSNAFSGELLNRGTGGLVIAAGGGATAGAAFLGAFERRRTESAALTQAPHEVITLTRRALGLKSRIVRRTAVVAGIAALALVLTAVQLGVLGLLLLSVAATVPLVRSGRPLAISFVIVASSVTVAEVLLGRLLLAPVGLLGEPLAVVAVAAVALAPLLALAGRADDWRVALGRVTLIDAASAAVGIATALSWTSVFRGLDDVERLTQVVQLGEDNVAHLLLLDATRSTGHAVGSEQSQEIAATFAGYFSGPSAVQAGLAGLLRPGADLTEAYVLTTAVLLGLVAAGATGLAGHAARAGRPLAAAGALLAGLVGARVALPMFEFGFPGQLLTVLWLVAALSIGIEHGRRGTTTRWWLLLLLASFVPAAVMTWSLAAPVLVMPVIAVGLSALRRHLNPSRRIVIAVGIASSVLALVLMIALRQRIFSGFVTLEFDGPVFRALPLWLSFALILLAPLALLIRDGLVPLPVSALLLGSAFATLILTAAHVARLGQVNYYGYKMQYLLFGLGWAAACLWSASNLGRLRLDFPGSTAVSCVALLVLAAAFGSWPATSYREWLQERGVLGPNDSLSCALEAASSAQGGLAVARGFETPVADYLTAKAASVGTRNDRSFPLWGRLLDGSPPATWTWPESDGPVLIISGPGAVEADLQQIVQAARASGQEAAIDRSCS
jgi:hypothetical protein